MTFRQTVAMMRVHHDTERPKSGYALIAFAAAIVLVELLRYWLKNHPLHWPPQAIAFVIGFVGFYIRNPKRTREGALFLVNGAVTLIGAIRPGGRRSTDLPVVALQVCPKCGKTEELCTCPDEGSARP